MSTINLKSFLELDFEPLNLRTKHQFGIAYGSSSDRQNMLVRLRYNGIEGLGEAAPAAYHDETPATVSATLQKFKQEKLLGSDPFAIVDICRKMDQSIAQNYSAKAAVEVALHDLCGKLSGLPIYKMFGLSGMAPLMTDFTIGIDSLPIIESKTKEALDAGYKILKVKQGTENDREIIRRIREVAPNLPLRVDANGSWTPKQTIVMSEFLSEQNVELIEQPLPKTAPVSDWKFVKEHSSIPIFSDESCRRSKDVAKLAGAVDGIVVKLAKTGGLSEALKVIHSARAHDMKIMLGCMIESSLGVTAAAHLSYLADYLDLDGALLLDEDPYQGVEYRNSYLVLNDKPGLGVTKR